MSETDYQHLALRFHHVSTIKICFTMACWNLEPNVGSLFHSSYGASFLTVFFSMFLVKQWAEISNSASETPFDQSSHLKFELNVLNKRKSKNMWFLQINRTGCHLIKTKIWNNFWHILWKKRFWICIFLKICSLILVIMMSI